MDTSIIIMIVLIILALYGLYVFIQVWSILTSGLVDMSVKQTIAASNITSPTSSTFYYSAWLYINGTSSGSLLKRELRVDVDGSNLRLTIPSSTTSIMITDQFPTNRWVCLVLNVVNGQFVEVYLNGKLVKSIQLTSAIPAPGKDESLIVGNDVPNGVISGYMTKLIRKPTNIDAASVWATYLQGNGKYSGMLFGILDYLESLGLKIDLSKNGVLQRQIALGNVVLTSTP